MDQIPILLRPAPTLEGLPLELMYMVLNAYKKDEYCPRTYILEQSDLCNLRLVSRRVHETTLHDFGKRIFTSRKHMLSRYSLYALRDISRHATFRHYVREVTIGPERVNPDFIGKDRDLTFSEDEVTEEDGNLSETETFPDGSDQESNDDDTAVPTAAPSSLVRPPRDKSGKDRFERVVIQGNSSELAREDWIRRLRHRRLPGPGLVVRMLLSTCISIEQMLSSL